MQIKATAIPTTDSDIIGHGSIKRRKAVSRLMDHVHPNALLLASPYSSAGLGDTMILFEFQSGVDEMQFESHLEVFMHSNTLIPSFSFLLVCSRCRAHLRVQFMHRAICNHSARCGSAAYRRSIVNQLLPGEIKQWKHATWSPAKTTITTTIPARSHRFVLLMVLQCNVNGAN